MKKIVVALLFGLVALAGSVFADVDCDSVTVCTLARDDGRCHPAVLFIVEQAQMVSGTVSVCSEDDCAADCSDEVSFGPFDFQAGLRGIVGTFEEEPSECTTLSTQWTIDDCDPACGNHHCVTPDCPVGTAAGNLMEIIVK